MGGVKRIIFASSVSVYGKQDGTINETTNYGAMDSYAASKIICEQLIIDWCNKNNIKFLILRIGNMYGPKEYSYKKIIGTFLILAKKNSDIVLFSDGTEKRNLVYVGDVCKCIKEILDNPQCHGIINAVSSCVYTVKECAEMVVKEIQSSSSIICLNKLHGRDDNIYDASRFLNLLGDKNNETSLECGIRNMRRELD